MRNIIIATVATIALAGAAHATPRTPQEVYNTWIAQGHSEANARAEAEAVAKATNQTWVNSSNQNINTASGGDARATGGNAFSNAEGGNAYSGGNVVAGSQKTSVGGQQSSQSVVVEGDRNPASSAIAPSLNIQHGGCDFSVGLSAAYQSYGQGVSGGGGLFWVRKETCYKVMIADRYLAMGQEGEAIRILREIEASFE